MNSLVTLSSSCLVCVGLCVCVFASCRVSVDVRETSTWAWSMDPTIRCHGIRNMTWPWISSLLLRTHGTSWYKYVSLWTVCCARPTVGELCACAGRAARRCSSRWCVGGGQRDVFVSTAGWRSVDFCAGQRSVARHKVSTDVFLVHSYWS